MALTQIPIELSSTPGIVDNSNATAITIDSSENVGIGTGSPSFPLHVSGPSTNYVMSETAGTGTSAGFRLKGDANADFTLFTTQGTNQFAIYDNANSTERMRIDASGNVGIGTSSLSAKFHVAGSPQATSGALAFLRNSDATASNTTFGGVFFSSSPGTDFSIGKSNVNAATSLSFRNGNTGASLMDLDSSGNLLVGKTAIGSNTVGFQVASNGKIAATVSGDETARFNRTTSDGSIVEFRRDDTIIGSIGSNGGTNLYLTSGNRGIRFNDNDFSPITSGNAYSDNTTDLGRTAARFDDIYATNGTIQTSDRNEKQDIEALSDAEQRVAVACKGLLRKYRWKSAVAEKGDEARVHFGIIAQDLQAAFDAEGLDAGRYAMFINSTWTDEETGEERSRMGVRYSELLAFIISAI